ncbi:hypothetical protein IscW_ISCW005107 [Ixodes scapularis]|uniref:Uncharacterized protein n=1 Tax=Ixodes scapularis TaxID=6945 RepID=B7PG30_IXOSC|nr:hypothetical protein IscW_ISCW005107 [Ixodes scapularis]|eukprot:XP_002434152.1 hypothetical protein IscW_ISCW005107 [Ixodes scapularis]
MERSHVLPASAGASRKPKVESGFNGLGVADGRRGRPHPSYCRPSLPPPLCCAATAAYSRSLVEMLRRCRIGADRELFARAVSSRVDLPAETAPAGLLEAASRCERAPGLDTVDIPSSLLSRWDPHGNGGEFSSSGDTGTPVARGCPLFFEVLVPGTGYL